jgi:hypothetical protein
MSKGGYTASFLMDQTIDEVLEIYEDLKGVNNG